MRITDKYVFFWRDPIAQWNISPMTDPTDGVIYNCAEQYMMSQKARLFGDDEAWHKVMNAAHPREQQAIGKTVKNFNQKLWDEHKYRIVCNGNMLKFTQHPKLLCQLLDSGDRLFVEASPKDLVWGIGMAEDEPGVEDVKNWRGENLLGNALTETRGFIRNLLLNKENLFYIPKLI